MLGTIDRRKLAALLMAALPAPPDITLQRALANALEDDRRRLASGLRFLIENSRPVRTTAFLLATAQFDWARDAALERQGLDGTLYDTPRRTEAVQYVKGNRDRFKPRYRAIPHGSWSQSIRRIRTCDDSHRTVALFRRTVRNMAFLRDAIAHSVMRLEGDLERD